MRPSEFLALIPHERVESETGEVIELFRLGTFDDGVWEFVCLVNGEYKPHIHHHTSSVIHVVYGSGIIILDGKRMAYVRGDSFSVPAGVSHGFEIGTSTMLLTRLDRPIKNPDTGEFDFCYE